MEPCPIMKGCVSACMVGCIVVWALVASALLWQCWNRVIATVTSVKQVKFWQALLVVVTLAAFCAPRTMMHKGMHGKGCCQHGKGMGEPCPFSGKGSSGKEPVVEDANGD